MNVKKSLTIAMAMKETNVDSLSARLNCSKSNLYKILTGSDPKVGTLERIAEALDMKLSDLIKLGE